MSKAPAPAALSDDELARVTGGKGSANNSDAGPFPGGMGLEERMAAIMAERANTINNMINETKSGLDALNNRYLDLSQGLNVLANAEKGLDGQGADATVSLDTAVVFRDQTTTLGEVARTLGLPADALQDGQLSKAELQSGIQSVKEQEAAVASQGQMEMIKLQSLAKQAEAMSTGAFANRTPKFG
ncbi:MAG: hypothetical protein OHK0024_06750 [Thalassobaculales bacterium]